MYPREDLITFARQKVMLRQSIALSRERCAEAAARVAQPIEVVDNVRTFWRQLSPVVKIAAFPLGVVITRKLFPRYRTLRRLVRWTPLVFTALRAFRSGRIGEASGHPSSVGKSRRFESGGR
jgi:hypothetical protein